MHLTKAASLILLTLLASTAQAEPDTAHPSTRMIESAGHRIAFHVTPGHLPVLVLDSGGGLDSTYWDSLIPELAKRTGCEIVTYDRAGFGTSDEVPGPWNVQSATDDLENGLKALGATKDVILVSHSIAGEIATYLTTRHPDWISGAVLVDANVPDVFTDKFIARGEAIYAPILAKLKTAPPSKQGRQLQAVAASFVETSRAFHGAAWPASVPAIVIVSEKTPFDDPADAKLWKEGHEAFAKKASNRPLVIADKSSHDVAHDRPDTIIDAVATLVAQAH